MIIVFQTDASEEEISGVEERLLRQLPHLHLRRINGEERSILAAVGDAQAVSELGLGSEPGVDRLVPIGESYKLAARSTAPERTSFLVGEKRWGKDLALVLGPCTVESPESALRAARLCAEAGADAIRAGIFKPRTSPFSFQGPGREGLSVLREIREETGLPVVSELVSSRDGEALAEVADVIQIGTRNMQNYPLLEVAGKLGRPILLKRGLAASLDEVLQAADYILREGEERVAICERGIRTFDQSSRFTLDLGAVPLLQEKTHLPIFVDPSHAAGRRDLVPQLARAAVAVGADGLLIESTVDPSSARCDADQQLDAEEIDSLVRDLRKLREIIP